MTEMNATFFSELKRVTDLQYKIDKEDPTAWPEYVAAIIELQESNPLLRSPRYIIEQTTSFLISTLQSHRKPVRYPRDVYEQLVSKMVLFHSLPLMGGIAIVCALDADDPTRLLEHAVEFSTKATGARFRRGGKEEHRQLMLRRARHFAEGRPVNESALVNQFETLYNKADQLRSHGMSLEAVIDFTTEHVLRDLERRTMVVKTHDWYHETICYIMAISEDAEFQAVSMIFSAQCSPDPNGDMSRARSIAEDVARRMDQDALSNIPRLEQPEDSMRLRK